MPLTGTVTYKQLPKRGSHITDFRGGLRQGFGIEQMKDTSGTGRLSGVGDAVCHSLEHSDPIDSLAEVVTGPKDRYFGFGLGFGGGCSYRFSGVLGGEVFGFKNDKRTLRKCRLVD
jgi:hypothetical protein